MRTVHIHKRAVVRLVHIHERAIVNSLYSGKKDQKVKKSCHNKQLHVMAHFDKRKAMRLSYTPISFHFRTFRFYFNCRLRACSFTWEHVPGTVSAGITGLFIVAMISRIISYPQSTANERGLKLHLS